MRCFAKVLVMSMGFSLSMQTGLQPPLLPAFLNTLSTQRFFLSVQINDCMQGLALLYQDITATAIENGLEDRTNRGAMQSAFLLSVTTLIL